IFAVMSATQGVGDSHPGQWLPFWRQACDDARPYACPYLADLQVGFCNEGSGWACNEAGLLHIALARSGEDLRRSDIAGAARPFRRGCDLGFEAACRNLNTLNGADRTLTKAPPRLVDYPIILQGSKGPVREQRYWELVELACREGWSDECAP